MTLKIGILRTGDPPADMAEYPTYPEMVAASLSDAYAYKTFDVAAGELPGAHEPLDGYVITGSPAGVYDGDEWIAAFKQWLRASNPQTPIVGICFGHQVMAEAFGGEVRKSEKGWGGGLQSYEVTAPQPWMDGSPHYSLPAAHQDQVMRAPETAQVVAASAFCPIAALIYTDRKAITFQAHPEFSRDFAEALVRRRLRLGTVSPEAGALAIASLENPGDADRVRGWMRRFLERA